MTIAKIPARLIAATFDLVIVIIISYLFIYAFNNVFPIDEYDSFVRESQYKGRGFLIGICIDFLYTTYLMQSDKQATLGMSVMGIAITKSNSEKIDFGTAALRYLISIPSSIFLKLGFFYALLNKKNQTLHDIICDTIVVDAQPSHEQPNEMHNFEPPIISSMNNSAQSSMKIDDSKIKISQSQRMNEEDIWEFALTEYESAERKKGLYAKLYSLNNGNEQLIKSEYIKERFAQLKNEIAHQEVLLNKQQEEYEKNKRAEESLLGGAFETKIINGLECFYFANKQAAIKVSEKKYRLYESESALNKSISHHKSNGMFLTTGLVRTIELS